MSSRVESIEITSAGWYQGHHKGKLIQGYLKDDCTNIRHHLEMELPIGNQSLVVISLLMLVLNGEINDEEFDYQGPEPRGAG